MTKREFAVEPLPTGVADAARRDAAQRRADHAIVVAESNRSCPCRHCLQWAVQGERMILFPFTAVPAGLPYSETGPIFVHEERCDRYAAVTQYPAAFRTGRVIRAYNSRTEIIGAQVVNGASPEEVVSELLQNSETAFLHVRSAGYGCYTFRINPIK